MTESPSPATTSGSLGAAGAQATASHLAELTSSGLPLAAGLRAAADQASGRSLRRSLSLLAEQLEQGRRLEDALADERQQFPEFLRRVMLAAVRTNDVSRTLGELIDFHRRRREMWRDATAALAYPIILLVFTIGLFMALDLTIFSLLYDMLSDVDIDFNYSPNVTKDDTAMRGLRWASRLSVWSLAAVVGAVGMWLLGARLLFGPPGASAVASRLPLVGPMGRNASAAEAAQFLSITIRRGIPLAEALQLGATSLSDGAMRRSCGQMASAVTQGQSFASAAARTGRLPEAMLPLLAWGERNNELAEALDASAEMLMARVHRRALMLCRVAPPIIFVLIGLIVGLMLAAVGYPLLQLLQMLT